LEPEKIIIAIDGYSSCGKSTLAKQLANRLGYVYIDTGAMYRAVALYAIENGLIKDNYVMRDELIAVLPLINIVFKYNGQNNKSETFLNGINVEHDIRGMEVSRYVSFISLIKEVRVKLVALQREMGKNKGIVMDGRDIGTAVFPNAELKIFMTADKDVRVKRRYDELKSKHVVVSMEEVSENLNMRDFEDSHREENPLKQAQDARVIDNTDLNAEEQFALVLEWVFELKNKVGKANF
jgi:cytidylate kinase